MVVIGDGDKVKAQSPAPGEQLERGSATVYLYTTKEAADEQKMVKVPDLVSEQTTAYAANGTLLNLGLNIFLIPRLGFMGGAVSYLASETVIYLLSLYLLGRCDDNAKANLGSTLPVLFPAAFALLMPILYEYLALRLLVLILPAVLMVNRGFRCLALVREKNT